MKFITRTLVILLAFASVTAMADEMMIIGKDRKKYFPASNRVRLKDKQGTLSFVDARDGQPYTLRRNKILYVRTDMPKDVLELENVFRTLKYDKVVKACGKVSAHSLWTGWGAYAYFLKGMAQISLKKYDDAAKTLKQAASFFAPAEKRDALIKVGLKVVQYSKNGGAIIDKPSTAAFLLNGLALEKNNDLRGAALEYMKAQELYPSIDKARIPDLSRLAAMARLVEVLKANRDVGTANRVAGELANRR